MVARGWTLGWGSLGSPLVAAAGEEGVAGPGVEAREDG